MHIGKVYIEDNMLSNTGVMTYSYLVKPKNSLFSAKTQRGDLVETMSSLITKVNMPGYIMIRPKGINNQKIYKYYIDSFKEHGHEEFEDLAVEVIKSLQKILEKRKRFRYDLFFVYCDGRDELKHRTKMELFTSKQNNPFSKKMMELFRQYEKEIFKKMQQKGLSVQRVNQKEELLKIHQYLAIPTEEAVSDYYVHEQPSSLKYTYQVEGSSKEKTLFSRTLVASKFERLRTPKKNFVDDVINCLQLESYPTDVIVKFDLLHTKEFKKQMAGKKIDTEKKADRYESVSNRIDREALKAVAVAEVGENADEALEQTKIRWQLFFRLRATTEKQLDKDTDRLRILMNNSRITLSHEFGEQIKVANNLFPYRSVFAKYTQLTDLSYFSQFNWLGGLFIGEEEEGFIETFTSPGEIPVLTDISKVFQKGQTSTHCSTTAYAGEAGGGKTQLADSRIFQYLIFRGMRTLIVDPKGDRLKKVAMLGSSRASHLIIGSPECQNGMFDSYLIHEDVNEALSQAKKDVDSLATAINMRTPGVLQQVTKAHNEMREDYQHNIIGRMSFTYMIEEKLMQYEPQLARELLTLRDDSMGRLFFSDASTTHDSAFNLNKMFNLVTFYKIPAKGGEGKEFDPNRLERAIFSVVLSRVQNVINGFMKRYEGEEKQLAFDEYKVYKEIDGGEAIVEHANRQVRSWLVHLYLISQSLSDISSSILNNVSDIFVGSIRSGKEIEYILNEMKLNDNMIIKDALLDRTGEEGVNNEKKYVFLMKDYNGRKCMTKNKILDVFEDSFNTLKPLKQAEVEKDIEKQKEDDPTQLSQMTDHPEAGSIYD